MTTNFPMHNLELSTVSRTALEGFTKSIAKKNDFPGININSILPGYFLTESLENFIKSNPEPDQENIKLKLLEKIPVGRFGKPEDFAKLCCFVSSEYGRFISGQSILINGGQVAQFDKSKCRIGFSVRKIKKDPTGIKNILTIDIEYFNADS